MEKEKAKGRDIRIVYSVLDAVEIARNSRGKSVVFLGIGFETTAPSTAAAILRAGSEQVDNFFVLSAHKLMPPVMKSLVDEGVKINGFIAPGHVSAITGSTIYDDLPALYKLGVVVSGFEPADIMQSVLMLARQIESSEPKVEIQYQRAVRREGNTTAQRMMTEVFKPGDDNWRGLGIIQKSGLKIRDEYSDFDAEKHFQVIVPEQPEPEGCICGLILRGLKTPNDCRLFARQCTPVEPVGACIVSGEGTCATFYKYRS